MIYTLPYPAFVDDGVDLACIAFYYDNPAPSPIAPGLGFGVAVPFFCGSSASVGMTAFLSTATPTVIPPTRMHGWTKYLMNL